MPLSYRHFIYGLAFLGRESLRRQLEIAHAVRAGRATDESFREWQQFITRSTEVPIGG